MSRRNHQLGCLGLILLLIGCQPLSPTGVRAPRPVKSPVVSVASPSPDASTPVTLPSNPITVAPSIAPPVAPVIGNNGGNLVGVIKAPATLVSNNGGSYRIQAAIAQVPVAGVTVALKDAAGKVVAETRTGADGKYGFTAALPTQNLILEVALPNQKGTVQAIVPKEGTGPKTVDADLVSTLTTGYILDQYVKGQENPVLTLDKLSADVEATTRQKADAALTGGTAAVPEALTAEKVVAVVNQLRTQDSSFNAQMEAVRRLLIVAGQTDLGSGRPGTEVSLGWIEDISIGADGLPGIIMYHDARVWRLSADGKLFTAAGTGAFSETSPVGRLGPEAGFDVLKGGAYDALGRLLLHEGGLKRGGLYRMEPNGRLVGLEKPKNFNGIVGDASDEAIAIADDALYALAPGQAPRKLGSLGPEFARARRYGLDAQGRVYLGVSNGGGTSGVWRMNADGTGATKLFQMGDDITGLTFDHKGNIFIRDAAGKLTVHKPDGTSAVVMTNYFDDFWLSLPMALAPDGTVYVALEKKEQVFDSTGTHNTVHRIKADKMELVAGGATVQSGAGDIALVGPRAVAFDAVGNLYIADGNRVLRLGADQKVTYFAGPSGTGETPVVEAPLQEPVSLHFDAEGNLYVFDREHADGQSTRGKLFTITPQNTLSLRYQSPTGRKIDQLVVAPDGGMLYRCDIDRSLHYLAPGGSASQSLGVPFNDYHLVVSHTGEFYVMDQFRLRKWSKAGGFSGSWAMENKFPGGVAGMTFDRDGRLFVAFGFNETVDEYHFDTQTFTTIAGAGGSFFNGASVEQALKSPFAPAFDEVGNMIIPDLGTKQIKRIEAGKY